MKIITFAAKKGGVGKTTLAYNYIGWLANKGFKVLAIDLDSQCNLTATYDIYDQNNTIGELFDIAIKEPNVKVHHVKPNIDLISGDLKLGEKEITIENLPNKFMILFVWLTQHSDLINQYDYVVLDTPPAFSTVTKNAIVISHDILSPITPDKFGYNAKFDLQTRFTTFKDETLDFNTMQSYVTANLYFIGNRIEKGRTSTKRFLKNLQRDQEENHDAGCIAMFPEITLLEHTVEDAQTLSDLQTKRSVYNAHKEFFDKANQNFEHITDML